MEKRIEKMETIIGNYKKTKELSKLVECLEGDYIIYENDLENIINCYENSSSVEQKYLFIKTLKLLDKIQIELGRTQDKNGGNINIMEDSFSDLESCIEDIDCVLTRLENTRREINIIVDNLKERT